jgi:Cys-tRNA(Pro)/Cys-tRNA(Cys) deacylase
MTNDFIKMKKTNAVRILDQHKIEYELVEYEVDETDLSAMTVAKKLGQDVEQVFKTLVLRGDKTGIFVILIPGNAELNLKKAAKVSGNKSSEMILMKELLPLTGYIRGGCTPIGMKKAYPNFIHESCEFFDFIYISAGVRGMQIKIAPNDLISLTNMTVGDFID